VVDREEKSDFPSLIGRHSQSELCSQNHNTSCDWKKKTRLLAGELEDLRESRRAQEHKSIDK